MAGAARDFARHVQGALSALYDSVALQTHPLVRHIPSERGRALSPTTAGRLLRQHLLEVISSLRPAGGREGGQRSGRAHRLLELRYVDGLDPEEVQRRLGVSKSLYYLDHKRALDAVAASLAERWGIPGADRDPAAPASASRDNLPTRWPALLRPLTSFVGRVREREQLGRLLGPTAERSGEERAVRLVTLLGPAGAGKTRLATEVALETAARGGRVHLVELAPIEEPTHLLAAITGSLGLHAGDDAALTESLATLDLLVLDNFEQLLRSDGADKTSHAAKVVASLIAQSSRVRVLVTSREPLRIYGEWELPVEPLPLGSDPETSDAVRLFVERARAVRPDFALTGETAPAIAEIVRRLDGLPLAIELAAARTRVLPPRELLARLERRLSLLTDGPRDLPSRQRTLAGALDWSYRLLEEGEREVFRRLAVLIGGAPLDTALEITGGSLEQVESLAAKSLLRLHAGPDGVTRTSMLEIVREYAWDRLLEAGELDDVQRVHAAHFLAFAEATEPHLVGPEQAAWLDRLEREYANVRSAVRFCADRGLAEDGLRLASALRQFWVVRGHWAEGRMWLAELLALAPSERTPVRAKALDRAAALAGYQGDSRLAQSFFEGAVALWRELGDQRGTARSLTGLANALVAGGESVSATPLFCESIDLLRAAGDEQGLATALGQLGIAHYLQGENAEAERLFEEALRVRSLIGDRSGIVHSLNMLGSVARCKGEYEKSEAYYRECLTHSNELGHRLATATVLYNLGQSALARGDSPATAADFFSESMALLSELGDRRLLTVCVESIGIAASVALPALGVRLIAAAETLMERSRMLRPPADAALSAAALAAARTSLGEARAHAEWVVGKGLRFEDAVDTALEAAAGIAAASDSGLATLVT